MTRPVQTIDPHLFECQLAQEAVAAWRDLQPRAPTPAAVTTLKPPHRRSAVFRLSAAGPNGTAVIAKRAQCPAALIERAVYEESLVHLPVRLLHFYGTRPAAHDEFIWLFLEDAGDTAFSADIQTHRTLAARWIAAAHTSAVSPRVPLPDRKTPYFAATLEYVRRLFDRSLANPVLRKGDRALLCSFCTECDVLSTEWNTIESLCAAAPQTLVLGDFSAKNARVRQRGSQLLLFPFDFGSSGWGVPAIDLADIDIATYTTIVHMRWPTLDIETVTNWSNVGRIFASLTPIPGEEPSLTGPWACKAMGKLEFYLTRLRGAMRTLGIAPSEVPEAESAN